jgi:drug/metabolite transporter (DMT)-like permease
MQKYAPLTVITYIFSFGAIYVLLFPPTIQDLFAADFSGIPLDIWLKIGFVILFVTFLAYLLMVYALSTVTATVSSSYIYLQPVMVIVFAFIFAGLGIAEDYTDTITFQKIGYMLIIFLGVFMVVKSKRNLNSRIKAPLNN